MINTRSVASLSVPSCAHQRPQFIPFCDRDPLMSQFPLALALEPRLLPYAVSNGFVMDAKYRNFIFRKMFEKAPDRTADRIVENIRELSKLDSACVALGIPFDSSIDRPLACSSAVLSPPRCVWKPRPTRMDIWPSKNSARPTTSSLIYESLWKTW